MFFHGIDLMAREMVSSVTNSMNYLLPYGDCSAADVERLVDGGLSVDECLPVRRLEEMRAETNEAHGRTHFSNPDVKREAEIAQLNMNDCIGMVKDSLIIFKNHVALGKITCKSKANDDI